MRLVALLAVLLIVTACSASAAPTARPRGTTVPPPELAPVGPMTLAEAGVVPAWMDRTRDPCNDFYTFACGGFSKTAEIPADRSSWGAIQIVNLRNEELLRDVLETAASRPQQDPNLEKLGAYYAACMDEPAIEKAGIAPIQPLLDTIAAVTDGKSAAQAVIALHQAAIFPFFAIGPQQDFADATKVIASIDQAGLGLPDRKYYLESSGSLMRTRQAYLAHVQRMFALLGKSAAEAQTAAASTLRIETALARVQQSDVVRRDPRSVYHRVDREGLERKVAPTFPWSEYFSKLGIPGVTAITVNDVGYYGAVTRMLDTEPAAALRDYLTWQVLRESANELGKVWVEEVHTMSRELSGLKELPPRWRRCVHRVDDGLGELLGRSYVRARFSSDAKARATELAASVIGAMRANLESLAWMDEPTRVEAKRKLDKLAYLIGFPETWRQYDFAVTRASFAANVHASTRWELARRLGKIGKPVDRGEWQMTPPTVNAYYDPTLNLVALPAGQLQAPFFDAAFHPAVNFGSTGGGTIGHEITHGFDDEGSQFDGDGNLRDWWTAATKAKFTAATTCIVDQYAKYEVVPGVKLDGRLTAGENIADNGGVKIAFAAYQRWKAQQTVAPQADVEGLTDDQLYFVSYAQSWCEKVTTERLETMAHSNPHAPPMWRVNGVVVNQPGFHAAFGCKRGVPMNPANLCTVW
ncbi:MAG: M13 family metallopeptidase [Deltaproteobacteria bacterium]|nr:M13 family metallopeptidase [Deltaproteobacteria bacterium]MDQ3297588.1 M13 family metallopeptidase [Myxococcota bacterium]